MASRMGIRCSSDYAFGCMSSMIHRTNPFGTPFFTSLLADLERITQSVFVGYMNGDLLLHTSFVESLQFIQQTQKNGVLPKKVMVMGRRTNVNASLEDDFTSFNRFELDRLIEDRTAFTDMFISCAVDIYVYNYGQLRLDDSPLSEMVIGRNKYDNYMVDYCMKNNITLIDISQSCII